MQTTVERIDETTVKLLVTVEAARVREVIERAARELATSVRVPGFRPGRAPRRVLESRLGKGAVVEEAVRDALPSFYAEAVQAERLPVVGRPSFDVTTFEDGKDAEFTATVEVRPEIKLPDYATLEVTHPEWEATDEEVDAELDALRDRFAELETVRRPADTGDFVVTTITGKRGEEAIEEVGGEDLLYQIGSADDAAINKALLGKEAGSIVRFVDTLGPDYPEALQGKEVSFAAIIKEVKRKKLPDLDDDFAVTASEFDTIEELRADLRKQLGARKRERAAAALRSKVVEAVSDLVETPLPESMVAEEVQFALARIGREAEVHGMDLAQLSSASGTTLEELIERLKEEARTAVKAQLVIDAVGRQAGIKVEHADLGMEVARQSRRLGRPPEELAEVMLHPDHIGALYTDAFRRKAIDHLVASVQVLSSPPPSEPES